ncbi:uncharacterized protein LAJ45_11108 [Morchella importuna]|uniref:uncharacterized protein n=1 Tax=Morchella importuna TaxID=1174673 RepID=UPI001E8CFC7B|nr:uncharacterized protein LAJ45_11108 [Morchella importuna]KAH8144902.1 hypothetical protein LAJ45_11108 [Morchella importuna]
MATLRYLVLSLLPFSAYALQAPVDTTTCGGKTFTYQELSGYGFVPSDFRDKFGDTLSFGSGIAIERSSWRKTNGSYDGILWMLPDRGWNTEGTTAYQPRIHKFKISFNPEIATTPSPPNLHFSYLDSILFTDPSGNPLAGLDPTTSLPFSNFPNLPASNFTGNGFGDAGPGGVRVSLDPEAVVLGNKGFWISDEYGPFIYHFDESGKMTQAIKPPAALIPMRNGVEDFSSDNPPRYDQTLSPSPIDPTSGRSNNQGFEGLTVSGDGKNLFALLQSATVQDGGLEKTSNRYARMLKYDISEDDKPRYAKEFVVPLPGYTDPSKKKNPRTAAQSEIFAVGRNQFFILSRDSGYGHGADGTESLYRQIDVFDITNATSIKGSKYDSQNSSITTSSSSGVLKSEITPATYCPFINMNNNDELAKFGLHNGGDQGSSLLNEKWEGLAIVPVDGKDGDDDWWYVIAVSDNDFITQNGTYNFGRDTYVDSSGYSLDSQALVFKVKLPDHSRPFDRS